jgi:hypothetical protein
VTDDRQWRPPLWSYRPEGSDATMVNSSILICVGSLGVGGWELTKRHTEVFFVKRGSVMVHHRQCSGGAQRCSCTAVGRARLKKRFGVL